MNQSYSQNTVILSPTWEEGNRSGIAQLTNSLHNTYHGSLIYSRQLLKNNIRSLHPLLKIFPYHFQLLIAYNLFVFQAKRQNPHTVFVITSIEYLPLPFLISSRDQLFFQDFIQLFYPRNVFVWFLYIYGFILMISGSFKILSCSESSINPLKRFLSNKRLSVYRHKLVTSDFYSPPKDVNCRDIDIFWLGTSAKHKNLGLLVEALQIIESNKQKVNCTIRIDNNYKNKERLYRVTQKLSSAVNIITRQVDDHELSSIYSRTKVFVSTSLMEGYCIPIRAAALHGAVPLISDISSFHDIHSTYSYFHKLTPQSLASMIMTILNDLSLDPTLPSSIITKTLHAADCEMEKYSGPIVSVL